MSQSVLLQPGVNQNAQTHCRFRQTKALLLDLEDQEANII